MPVLCEKRAKVPLHGLLYPRDSVRHVELGFEEGVEAVGAWPGEAELHAVEAAKRELVYLVLLLPGSFLGSGGVLQRG